MLGYKDARTTLMTFEDVPWTEVVMNFTTFCVFLDQYPVTEGHVLFVPKKADWEGLAECYRAAYMWGHGWMEEGYCDGFNLGQNVGVDAGQSVEYPHVHLIPRRKGDMENPQGGVRHVIPEKGNY